MRKTLILGVLTMALFTTRSTAQAESREIPGWNLSFDLPDGFHSYQALGHVEFYRKDADGHLLIVTPAVDASVDEALRDLSPAFQALGMSGSLDGEPRKTEIAGCEAVVADATVADALGRRFDARYVALMTPHGTSLRVLGLTTQGKDAIRASVLSLAESLQARAPQVDENAMAALAGTWVVDTGNYGGGIGYGNQETLAFDGQGGFRWSQSSYVSVPEMPSDIDPTSQQGEQGTCSVIGGCLVARTQTGSLVLPIQIQGGSLNVAGKSFHRP